MRGRSTTLALVSLLSAALAIIGCQNLGGGGQAQGLNDLTMALWQHVNGKALAMAKEFPEELYDYRPTPEVRSFKEQILHIIGGERRYIEMAGGALSAPPEDIASLSKAEVIERLEEAIDTGATMIDEQGGEGFLQQGDLWLEAIEHTAEHTGQVVLYLRLNGIVPPFSRPAPEGSQSGES